jgi:hypothetical protein
MDMCEWIWRGKLVLFLRCACMAFTLISPRPLEVVEFCLYAKHRERTKIGDEDLES